MMSLSLFFSRYLSGKIKEGNAHNIVCPAYDCDRLVPVEAIERLVSREMARRYLQFDINVSLPIKGCCRFNTNFSLISPDTLK